MHASIHIEHWFRIQSLLKRIQVHLIANEMHIRIDPNWILVLGMQHIDGTHLIMALILVICFLCSRSISSLACTHGPFDRQYWLIAKMHLADMELMYFAYTFFFYYCDCVFVIVFVCIVPRSSHPSFHLSSLTPSIIRTSTINAGAFKT